VLSRETSAALLALAQRLHVTPFVVMLTVFGAVLHRTTGQDRIAIGTPVSLRDEPGLERVAGMLINSVAVPTVWSGALPFAEAARSTGDAVLDSLDFRRCPFDQLVADLRPPRDGRRNPIFQVMFSYSEGSTPIPHLRGLTVERVATPARAAKMELTFNVALVNGTMRLELEWNAGRLDATAAARLADSLLYTAEAVAEDPAIAVRLLPV
jgi:non-ribosomal peptide synthetase component F